MRLIKTSTGQFKEFFDSQRPRYAILSHTWGEEEVSYIDLLFFTSNVPTTAMGAVQMLLSNKSKDSAGFRKVEECCKLARSRGFEWVWIDSCCIDKSSSAELSEAINSMWSWYQGAEECYVYLFDVPAVSETSGDLLSLSTETRQAFRSARWFGRGWTLQELLAPKHVLFCDQTWQIIATKAGIAREISRITSIPLIFLDGTYSPSDPAICSIATKMSWVAHRQTTRTEDMAYCMLGLFNVHMPLIYGEGRKAFMRLQLEILRKSDDDSIFAWQAPLARFGMLATWPTAFADSGHFVQVNFPEDETPWLPPSISPLGLEMRARYQRHDPEQARTDARYGVHTITTAIPVAISASMVIHCRPCERRDQPVTQTWGQRDSGQVFVINLRRSGATWQRVNCGRLETTHYSMYSPSTLDAYMIYFIEQQGL